MWKIDEWLSLMSIVIMIYLGVKDIYLPLCTSNVITPNMLQFIKNKFDFKQVTPNPVIDLQGL